MRKALAVPKGTPAPSIPVRMGMVEQEQKGVRAPNTVAGTMATDAFFLPRAL